MERTQPSMPSVEARPDAVLLRAVWLLNAAVVSFTEANQLLSEIAATLPAASALLRKDKLSVDRQEFFRAEIARFEEECSLLADRLVQARRAANGD